MKLLSHGGGPEDLKRFPGSVHVVSQGRNDIAMRSFGDWHLSNPV